MPAAPADFSQQEQNRLVAAAYDLFMERGISPVTLGDVALSTRLPAATIER